MVEFLRKSENRGEKIRSDRKIFKGSEWSDSIEEVNWNEKERGKTGQWQFVFFFR